MKHLTPCFVDADKDDLNSRASSFRPGRLMKENNNKKVDLLFMLSVSLFNKDWIFPFLLEFVFLFLLAFVFIFPIKFVFPFPC